MVILIITIEKISYINQISQILTTMILLYQITDYFTSNGKKKKQRLIFKSRQYTKKFTKNTIKNS